MTPEEQYEEDLKHPSTQAFLALLRGGVAAEGNSLEELEEISGRLVVEYDPYSQARRYGE